MAIEVFSNLATTFVVSGGADAPAPGTSQTWTVSSSSGFPAASNSATPPTQFHIADISLNSEIITVTNISGTTWTVTRGTTPVSHQPNFVIYQVITASFLNGTFQPGNGVGAGGQLYSGSGAPNITGSVAGDYYFRTDTPGVANQRIYIATGSNTWSGIL